MPPASMLPVSTRTAQREESVWMVSCGSGALELGRRTLVMGVVNVTPDSFSDGGQCLDVDAAVSHALALQDAGADLLDIGGESTRPGAQPVAATEELQRVLPVIEQLAPRLTIPLSIDTSKAAVARATLTAGASLVNDVTALRGDPAMADVVADTGCPIVLMHMAGTPQTMQHQPRYTDVVAEVRQFFVESVARAVSRGIAPTQILLDPGIGFGKTVAHNLALLAGLPVLAELERPLVVGVSRKAFIGELTGRGIEERAWGTAGAVAMAASLGAAIVRVHDVAAMRDVVRVVDAITRGRAA